jgi:L,D-peptidoglycan transpeptidase YkuD (ErfK/YbiS/YcfS/YnhG family)
MKKFFLVRLVLYVVLLVIGWGGETWWRLRPVPGQIELRCRAIRSHLQSASSDGLMIYFANQARELDEEVQKIRLDAGEEQQRLWFLRDYSPLLSRLEGSQSRSMALLSAFRDARLRDRSIAEQTFSQATERLLFAESYQPHASRSRQFRFNLTQAQLKLETAGWYLSRGAYHEAIPLVADSLELVDSAMGISRKILARYADPALREWWGEVVIRTYQASRRNNLALLVDKEQHELAVLKSGKVWRTMSVDIGAASYSRKLTAGDRATPEGLYRVIQKKKAGQTRFGLAFLLDYPNTEDRRRFNHAIEMGLVPADAGIGGLIEIHGHGGRGFDWTDGCIAPADEDMQWLFERIPQGTTVGIVGASGEDSALRELSRRLKESPPEGE